MKTFRKILIANRAEIAVRIIKTLRKMNIKSVAVFSPDEKDSLHRRLADESFMLPGNKLSESYLNAEEIIRIAGMAGAEAIHPGYGFLSENSAFAQKTEDAGLVFIGPPASAVSIMGNKLEARKLVKRLNIPLIKSVEGDIEEILSHSDKLTYPVMIKAAAGGGGKAMRIVRNPADLTEALDVTAREAMNYFGDGRLYAENYYDDVRHIEIQLMADHYGNIITLGERECSVQRRYQKVIEETPSSFLKEETRRKMISDSVRIAREISYHNAGTIEFLVDPDQNYFFLEMNTRIQVEHPVTEMVNNRDIVEMQVEIAAGNEMKLQQENVRPFGHAIQARIYAENPDKEFLPSPGNIFSYTEPDIPGIRVDSVTDRPVKMLPHYDPLIAKLIVHADNRNDAVGLLSKALHSFIISGTNTNRELLMSILNSQDFMRNDISTLWLERNADNLNRKTKKKKDSVPFHEVLIAWISYHMFRPIPADVRDVWRRIGYWRQQIKKSVVFSEKQYDIYVNGKDRNSLLIDIEKKNYNVRFINIEPGMIYFELNGKWIRSFVNTGFDMEDIVFIHGLEFKLKPLDYLPANEFMTGNKNNVPVGNLVVRSPLHGRIVKLNAIPDRKVHKGEVLFTLDAMKIENKVLAPVNGWIRDIMAGEGDQVSVNQSIIILEEKNNNSI